MSQWLFFALAANVMYTGVTVFDQFLRKKHIANSISATVLWLFLFFFVWLAIVPFIDISLPALPQLVAGLTAGFLVVITTVTYFHTLNEEEASSIMPIWQFSSVFVLALSIAFLGEKLFSAHYAGFVLILVASLFLSVHKTIKGLRVKRTALLVLAASIVWAIRIVLEKYFFLTESFWNGLFWIPIGSFIGAIALLFIPKAFSGFRSELASLVKTKQAMLVLAASTLLTFAADLGSWKALQLGPASLVSIAGATQLMFLFVLTALLSRFFPNVLKERIDRKALLTKFAAISLMIIGLYLIS